MKKALRTCLATAIMLSAVTVQAAELTTATTEEAFTRLGYARQAVEQDPPKNALLNSPLATHPMFNQVFASLDESKLNEAAAQLMAAQFTSDELRALVDFQNSPEGKSIHQKMPAYQQLLGATMQNYLSAAFQQMMLKQGGNGASNIPINPTPGTGSGSALPPMNVPASATPAAPPSGAGTPLKH